jgi:hypothetical protein
MVTQLRRAVAATQLELQLDHNTFRAALERVGPNMGAVRQHLNAGIDEEPFTRCVASIQARKEVCR